MLKRFKALSKDQHVILISVVVIMLIMFAVVPFFTALQLVVVWFPIQFVISFLFARHQLMRSSAQTTAPPKKQSHTLITTAFMQAGCMLTFIAGSLAIAHQNSKPLAVFCLISPLILTRTILLIRKLPIAVLYPKDLLPTTHFLQRSEENPVFDQVD